MDISMRYYAAELKPEELFGSTFTVTDLSGHNILSFQPLINGEQSAILGIGGDRGIAGWPMSFTITFDHRVLTGREVAEFLNELRTGLASYELEELEDENTMSEVTS